MSIWTETEEVAVHQDRPVNPPLPPSNPRLALPLVEEPSSVDSAVERPSPRNYRAVGVSFVAGAVLSAASFGLGTLAVFNTAAEPANIVEVAQPIADTPDSGERSAAAAPTQTVAAVAASLGPSVVQIETDRGLGSGVVFDDGLVMSNHHVIEGASSIQVRTNDGRAFETSLVGSDPRNDIAVLSLGAGTELPVASLAVGQPLQVGEQTIAIGSPFQLQQTVTAGIVSALNRPVPNNGGGMTAMIQTDAPINPGNSGGALANAAGEVIGINTSIRTDGTSNSNVGIGFAVPIDTALGVANRIVSGATLEAGVLGVQAPTSQDDEVGVIIGDVVADGAAATAGLVSGDRVLSVDGAPVTNFSELVGLVQSNFGGDTVSMMVVRNGQTTTVAVTLD